ncbi:VOC family protein, partial [Burkholderia cepacia]
MRIYVTSIFVDDQDKALTFYTDKLGFKLKNNVPVGEYRWLTVVSKDQPDGTELLLEPSNHRAVGPYKQALYEDGIPAASFQVDGAYPKLCVRGINWRPRSHFYATQTQG